MAHSPDTVQITEVQFLPEAASEAIANPAGNGQNPQARERPGQTQHSLICATVWQRDQLKTSKIAKQVAFSISSIYSLNVDKQWLLEHL